MKRILTPRNLRNVLLASSALYTGLYLTGQIENAYCLANGLGRAARAIAYGGHITVNYFRVIFSNIVWYT